MRLPAPYDNFAAIADAQPDAIAIDGLAGRLTYGELRAAADHVVCALREHGVRPRTIVGLALERSPAQIASVLAVTKLGATYLPVDPHQPAKRSRQVFDQANCPLVVTTAGSRHLADGRDFLDADPLLASPATTSSTATTSNADPAPASSPASPASSASPDDVACVLFTSGSTGVPKGVAVTRRNLSTFVDSMDFLKIGPGSRVGQIANPAFDVASFEIWVTLGRGGTVVTVPSWPVIDVDTLAGFLADYKITTMFLTASLMRAVVARRPEAFAGMRHLLFGGEPADAASVTALLKERDRPDFLINAYGPTEATTFSIMHTIPDSWDGAATAVPIGRATQNARAYVLDDDLRPVPPGGTGQIYLAGDAVTRGYLDAPGLTADRFLPCPFGGATGATGATMYRTGDLAILATDGTITYLGRIDGQVKIRGNRVELAEVETAIAAAPGIGTAAAAVWEPVPGDRRIVAAVVPTPSDPNSTGHPNGTGQLNNTTQLNTDDLRASLRDRLPEYMIPSHISVCEQLPLNPNGKIDRDAVARLVSAQLSEDTTDPSHDDDHTALITAVWEEVLHRQVQPEQNFFDAGGDSLLLLEVHARLEEAFDHPIALTDLLEHPTISGLAEALATQPTGQP